MKVLITGASGFIGSFLVEEALRRGYEVYAGVRKSSNLQYLQDERIHLYEMDLTTKDAIKRRLFSSDKFDYIIHCAGLTKTCQAHRFEEVNFDYTKNLLDALIEINYIPKKFILVSSLAAYGPGDAEVLLPVIDSGKPNPVSFYGESKLKIENYLQGKTQIPSLIFRPTGVFGPRERDFYVMYQTINKGWEVYVGSKEQHLTFIYVKDLVRLFLDAMTSNIVDKSFFASDMRYYTAEAFNASIKKALNKKTRVIIFPKFGVKMLAVIGEKLSCLFGKVPTLNTEKYKEISQRNWLCDSSDLKYYFDFQPQYSLEEGIQETIEWFKKEQLL